MKLCSMLLYIFLISGCITTEYFGRKSSVEYAGYDYRGVYTNPVVKSFGQNSNVIRNIRFCSNSDNVCKNIFPTNAYHLPDITFIDKRNETGKRKRVFFIKAYKQDTNSSGSITNEDLSTLYAYDPVAEKLVTLAQDVTFIDMESVVTSFTFFIKFKKKDRVFLSQIDLESLDVRKTVVWET
ncbi:hypothetical protein [Planctobacterium marinum]|uniref:hypothetical protein n=1 Tax=Planctobacterium marinum TaxID=1631968 RepID=UPI001E28E2A6|nr:hypothetical protein [Planctobacterium marinum]MCC2607548.1 hypothetical protein [Planctobacterium marinum]